MMAFTREPSSKACIDHRARFIDAPSDGAHNTLDDLVKMAVVLEDDIRLLEPAFALDVHQIETVHQDVGDRRVGQQALERA